MIGLNIGSGQRRFESTDDFSWVNVDCISRPPDQVPDLLCDVRNLPYNGNSVDFCVLHHVYEHFNLGEGDGLIKECFRVLRPLGSLIITIPDMKALAEAWLSNKINNYIYFVNVYGAYQGNEGDIHRWGYTRQTLMEKLPQLNTWSLVTDFDWRNIPGSLIAKDWWICAVEAIK